MECDFSAVLWVHLVAVMRVMAYQGNERFCHICEWYHCSHMSRLAKRCCDCAVLRTAFTLAVDSTIAHCSPNRPRNHVLFICLTAINVCRLDFINLKGGDRLGCWVPSNASLCDRLFEGCVLHEHVAKEGGNIWVIKKWKAVPPYPPLPP